MSSQSYLQRSCSAVLGRCRLQDGVTPPLLPGRVQWDSGGHQGGSVQRGAVRGAAGCGVWAAHLHCAPGCWHHSSGGPAGCHLYWWLSHNIIVKWANRQTKLIWYISGDNFLEPTYKLENDPMCGITTGGKENCYWDCTFVTDPYVGSLITTPECLLDCYEEVFKFGQSNNIMKLQTYLLIYFYFCRNVC